MAIDTTSNLPVATLRTTLSAESTSLKMSYPFKMQKVRVAAQASRLFPSTKGWFRAIECINAAALSGKVS